MRGCHPEAGLSGTSQLRRNAMNEPDSTHPLLPACAICGAGPEKRQWSKSFTGAYGAGLIMLIVGQKQRWFGNTPNLETAKPVVCTQCGHVQFFVDPTAFKNQ